MTKKQVIAVQGAPETQTDSTFYYYDPDKPRLFLGGELWQNFRFDHGLLIKIYLTIQGVSEDKGIEYLTETYGRPYFYSLGATMTYYWKSKDSLFYMDIGFPGCVINIIPLDSEQAKRYLSNET